MNEGGKLVSLELIYNNQSRLLQKILIITKRPTMERENKHHAIHEKTSHKEVLL